MNIRYPYLKDILFLKEVDEMQNKKQVVRITILDLQEKPIQSIEGRITGGNLNINASSAIRRTGSLSLIADEDKNDLTNINSLFYLNKKVKLEIGFKNTTNKYLEYEAEKGSVLVLTALGRTLTRSTELVYKEAENIKFNGIQYRKDICKPSRIAF